MARVDPERIRNVALLGHSHDGKTSLAEAMLYAGGAVDRLGRPDAGNTTFDFEPEVTAKLALAGRQIREVPIGYTPRRMDEGKKIRWIDGVDAIVALLKCRFER